MILESNSNFNAIATPEENDDAVFQDANGGGLLNSTFESIKEQAASLLKSPNIGALANCTCQCGIDTEKRIVQKLNKTLASYFSDGGAFHSQLENLVENKIHEMASNNSILNATCVESPKPTDAGNEKRITENVEFFKENYEDFDSKYRKYLENQDKTETKISGIETDYNALKNDYVALQKDIVAVQAQLNTFQHNFDEQLANEMQKNESAETPVSIVDFLELKKQVAKNVVDIDRGQQYTGLEIIEFWNIPLENTRWQNEDCYQIIINFLRIHFGMNISRQDISICHRQPIPSERKKLGNKFIPPIYCKFLHRTIAHKILKKRNCLDGTRNKFGQPYFIKENLTPSKRLLWDSVQTNLASFEHKYIQNGKIFVKRNQQSRPFLISSENDVKDLIGEKAPAKNTVTDTPTIAPSTLMQANTTHANISAASPQESVTTNVDKNWPMPSYACATVGTSDSRNSHQSAQRNHSPHPRSRYENPIFAPSAASYFSNSRLSTYTRDINPISSAICFRGTSLRNFNSSPF